MNKVTHALTMNGRVHGELKDPGLSPQALIGQRLNLLDGVTRYSLSLWRLPEGVPFDRVDLKAWPQEYVQAAGSREAMTLEVRRLENSQPSQYVIGRGGGIFSDSPVEVRIPWNGFETRVFSTEVFSATEAVEVFVSYFAHGEIPDILCLRPLAL